MSVNDVLICCGSAQATRLVAEVESAYGDGRCMWKATGRAGREAFGVSTPQVAVIGPGIGDVAPVNLVAALARDRAERNAACPIILVDPAPSGSLASRARAAGALQVVTYAGLSPALAELGLETSGTAALEEPMQGPTGAGKVVVVAGGRGGVGVSTVSAMLAAAAARRGLATLLVDLDAQCRELAYELGSDDAVDLADLAAALEVPRKIATLPQRIDAGAHLVSAPGDKERIALAERQFGSVVDVAAKTFVLIVVDIGAVWQAMHVEALNRADFVLFSMDQRPASVRACHEAADFAYRLGVPAPRMGFVLNRCAPGSAITPLDAAMALDGAHVYELPEGGEDVDEAFADGRPSRLFEGTNPLALEAEELLVQLGELLGIELDGTGASRRRRPRARGLLRRRRVAGEGEE